LFADGKGKNSEKRGKDLPSKEGGKLFLRFSAGPASWKGGAKEGKYASVPYREGKKRKSFFEHTLKTP